MGFYYEMNFNPNHFDILFLNRDTRTAIIKTLEAVDLTKLEYSAVKVISALRHKSDSLDVESIANCILLERYETFVLHDVLAGYLEKNPKTQYTIQVHRFLLNTAVTHVPEIREVYERVLEILRGEGWKAKKG